MIVRQATAADLGDVLAVERAAFGEDDEADLVVALLDDPSAAPLLSLLAFEGEVAVGHVLFTSVRVDGEPGLAAAILAPLAVVPEHQGFGVGTRLVEHGLGSLRDRGADLVFVVGHPDYYPRFGFEPAGAAGFEAPFPIPAEHADAWMVLALDPDARRSSGGKVLPADELAKPELWRE